MRPPHTRSFGARQLAGLLLVLAVWVVGCSSGGDSPTHPAGTTVSGVESLSLDLLNDARAGDGVGALTFNPSLAIAARRHSEAMRDQGFFAHVDPSGADAADRIVAVGVQFSLVAENIAQVSHPIDPATLAHREFMRSVDHRENILDPQFTEAGVGAARAGETWWITQLFIKP